MAPPPRLSPLQRGLSHPQCQEGDSSARPCCALRPGSFSLLTALSKFAGTFHGLPGDQEPGVLQPVPGLDLALRPELWPLFPGGVAGRVSSGETFGGTGLKRPCFGAAGTSPRHREAAADLRHSGTLEAPPMNQAHGDLFFKDTWPALLPFPYKGHTPAFVPS